MNVVICDSFKSYNLSVRMNVVICDSFKSYNLAVRMNVVICDSFKSYNLAVRTAMLVTLTLSQATHFRLFLTQSLQMIISNFMKMVECSPNQ